MAKIQQHVIFVLASTNIGSMILSRMDYDGEKGGVGAILLAAGDYERGEINNGGNLLRALKATRGEGVVAIDGGANIGTHTVDWANGMRGWGEVLAFEPQRAVYYALCGNIALNNVFSNARAFNLALSDEEAIVTVPAVPTDELCALGSLSLLEERLHERSPMGAYDQVTAVTIDSLDLARLDLLKLDVEGMELRILAGARATIARHKPVVVAEHIFCPPREIEAALPGYRFFPDGMNTICIPEGDPLFDTVKIGPALKVATGT